jgi:peptidoglycan hydrolase-like protein with peptidoglycan-binding domain
MKVFASVAEKALPVSGAKVTVRTKAGEVLYELTTDADGQTSFVQLDAPNKENTFRQGLKAADYYSVYDVSVTAESLKSFSVRGVQIFDEVSSVLPVNMTPVTEGDESVEYLNELNIGDHTLAAPVTRIGRSRKVSMPININLMRYITVRLGSPDIDGEQVSVFFMDYVKNVAACEIFPTWPKEVIKACALCVTSLALNRFYTEWYPSNGKRFDISSLAKYDQRFMYGRNVYLPIDREIDGIFDFYISDAGDESPLFAEMSDLPERLEAGALYKWGALEMAEKGYLDMEIIRSYMGENVTCGQCATILGVQAKFPGTPLVYGMTSPYVETMQDAINRVADNFKLIPHASSKEGFFGDYSLVSVKNFQSTFDRFVDGVVGKKTWYAIMYQAASVDNLERLLNDLNMFDPYATNSENLSRVNVYTLQKALNFISLFYPFMPNIMETGIYDQATVNALKAFQRFFKIPETGEDDLRTSEKILSVFLSAKRIVNILNKGIANVKQIDLNERTLSEGMVGADVLTLQRQLNMLSSSYMDIPRLREDGFFGARVGNRVREFQRYHGLAETGIVTKTDWEAINNAYYDLMLESALSYPGEQLSIGSRGSDVLLMQKKLNVIVQTFSNINPVKEDGFYSVEMAKSVQQFQAVNGLPANGIIGENTWASVSNKYNAIMSERQKMEEVDDALAPIEFARRVEGWTGPYD